MISVTESVNFALALGFSHAAPLDTAALRPMEEVRGMCASGRCAAYGHLWSCPPACGSLDFTARCMASYESGVIVQTTGQLEDDFDIEAIQQTEAVHKANFSTLARRFRLLEKDCLPLTAGGCRICIKCTCPDRPCRFPGRMLSSMEAYGLLVSDVCKSSGLEYNYGAKTITYTSCILFNKKGK